jgi:hypothetical protein
MPHICHKKRVSKMSMSARLCKTLSLFFALVVVNPSYAGDGFTWFGEKADGNWLAGVKMASVQNGRSGYDDAANVAVVLGYQFSRVVGIDGKATIELELANSFDNGDITANAGFGIGGNWETENMGLHFAYRTPGSIYFLGKFGLLNSEVTTNLDGLARFSERDTALSYGAGLGIHLGKEGNFNLEFEFTGSNSDNDLTQFSIGGIYLFP